MKSVFILSITFLILMTRDGQLLITEVARHSNLRFDEFVDNNIELFRSLKYVV